VPNTKFYTGKVDGGATLLGKCKVPKDDMLFQLLGGMDELNSSKSMTNDRLTN